jgi:hypothetical protein
VGFSSYANLTYVERLPPTAKLVLIYTALQNPLKRTHLIIINELRQELKVSQRRLRSTVGVARPDRRFEESKWDVDVSGGRNGDDDGGDLAVEQGWVASISET